MIELPVIKYHNDPRFAPYLERAHQFVKSRGVEHIAPLDSMTVVEKGTAEAALRASIKTEERPTEHGWYFPVVRMGAVVATPDMDNPDRATQRLLTDIEHELTHSGSQNLKYHRFYNEALAGMVEQAQHVELQQRGERQTPAGMVLERAGVRVVVPGEYRYHGGSQGGSKVNASQGLIAAHSFELAEQAGGIARTDILSATRPDDHEAYERMRASLNALHPQLVERIDRYPQTTDGIVQAAASVQLVARQQGLLPPLNVR